MSDDDLEPCTEEAYQNGCLCRLSRVDSASRELPHAIINPYCPLHGLDPDEAYERWRDERDQPKENR